MSQIFGQYVFSASFRNELECWGTDSRSDLQHLKFKISGFFSKIKKWNSQAEIGHGNAGFAQRSGFSKHLQDTQVLIARKGSPILVEKEWKNVKPA